MNRSPARVPASQYYPALLGVEPGVALVRVGCLGTLLGPEASASGSSLCPPARDCAGWGLVGLLFEICIVDASI